MSDKSEKAAISLGLEIIILIVIALALLVVILFLIMSGILSPITHITNVTNHNVTVP
jgi:hypothetical protein